MTCVSLSLHRFGPIRDRLWVLGQMGAARLRLARVPDVAFWKLCGSGTGEGFTPVPNTAVWAILATWPNEETARNRVAEFAPFTTWAARAEEAWTVFMSPLSQRGQWSGQKPFLPTEGAVGESPTLHPPGQMPVAALTRATVRPRAMGQFWARSPGISDVIGRDPNVAFKIGIGEVPWLQQVTFSIWPSTGAMAAFARDPDGPHAKAIRAVRAGGWFREELYARFRPLGDSGTWDGRSLAERLSAEPGSHSAPSLPGYGGGAPNGGGGAGPPMHPHKTDVHV